ncbi:MAG: ATPase domain-containing protein [Nanoarchaeota archaeon]
MKKLKRSVEERGLKLNNKDSGKRPEKSDKRDSAKVKEEKKEKRKSLKNNTARVPTYIPNFDSLIGGGFERKSTSLIVGGSGSGKTIFAVQFLLRGMEKGEKCLFVTFEEKKEQFYANMKDFGWDLESYEKKGLFTFLEYTPSKVKTMLEEGGGFIETIVVGKKISRMVIDSITSFELLFEDELSKREAALFLFGMIRDWDCTSLLTLEVESSDQSKISSRTLEFEADAIVVLYFVRNGGERRRFLEVLKMRGTKHSKKVYPFDISGKGIVVSKNPASNFLENNRE